MPRPTNALPFSHETGLFEQVAFAHRDDKIVACPLPDRRDVEQWRLWRPEPKPQVRGHREVANRIWTMLPPKREATIRQQIHYILMANAGYLDGSAGGGRMQDNSARRVRDKLGITKA